MLTKVRKYTNIRNNTAFLFVIVFCFVFSYEHADAAELYFMPSQQEVFSEGYFISELLLDTKGETINALDVDILFPADVVEVLDISTGGSVFTLFIQQPFFSNEEGIISFAAGVPHGYSGVGSVAKIFFKAKIIGDAVFSIGDDSQVLLHDGKGTPAEVRAHEGSFTVVLKPPGLPVITAQFHPDQNAWYGRDEVYLNWKVLEGALYSYIMTRDAFEEPDEVADEPVSDIKYEGLGEGIFYFALREKSAGEDTFGPTVRYRIMIDRSDPEPFDPALIEIEGQTYLTLSTTDKISGIEYYEVKVEGEEEWMKIEGMPYPVGSLRGELQARAVDGAGNTYTATIQLPVRFSFGDFIWLFIIIVLGGISILVYLWFKRRTNTIARFTLR